jgi:hypothetical protein
MTGGIDEAEDIGRVHRGVSAARSASACSAGCRTSGQPSVMRVLV